MAQAQRGRTHRHPLSQMASVAIANAGQLRVMLHPLVVQSFALMRNGLAHDGHRVTTFVALGNVSDTKLAEVRATYGAAVVVNVPGMLACNVRCELPCDTRKTGVFQWLDPGQWRACIHAVCARDRGVPWPPTGLHNVTYRPPPSKLRCSTLSLICYLGLNPLLPK